VKVQENGETDSNLYWENYLSENYYNCRYMLRTPICRDPNRIPIAKLVIDVWLLQCNLN